MTQLRIEISVAIQRVDELEAYNEQLLTELNTLQQTEEALAAMWEGAAKDAFRAAFQSDMEQMINFYNAIRSYIIQLRLIIAVYRAYEAANEQLAVTRSYR